VTTLARLRHLVHLAASARLEHDLADGSVDRVALDGPPADRVGREDTERLLDRAVDGDRLADDLDDE
jgi:hypothetical protein